MTRNHDKRGYPSNNTIGFDVSLEERAELDQIAASRGMNRTALILESLESREFIFIPNQKIFNALAPQFAAIDMELSRIRRSQEGGNGNHDN